MALVCATDKCADGGDTDYRTAWGRLCGHLFCAGLDGVECASEVGG
jgi:hypothetical protein